MMSRTTALVLAGVVFSLMFGWFVFPALLYKSVEQPIQFSHAVHTGEAVGMKCEDCHAIREDGRFSGIPNVQQCAGCHQEQVGTSENEKKLVEEYVKKNREVPWLVYARQPENTYFSHVRHVKEGQLACERCHGPHGTSTELRSYEENRISGYSKDIWGSNIARIKFEPWQGMKMDDCVACHETKNAQRACIDCHK
ncbi:MAG: menaquinone reductase multiheme cytochrome c subunit QrcA [Bacteroidota bacterium]